MRLIYVPVTKIYIQRTFQHATYGKSKWQTKTNYMWRLPDIQWKYARFHFHLTPIESNKTLIKSSIERTRDRSDAMIHSDTIRALLL